MLGRKSWQEFSVSVSVLSSISAQEVTKEPNIIIIMADQLRVDLLQREGYPLNTMPFADNLAKMYMV